MVLHGSEPAFDLCLLCRSVRPAIPYSGADPCRKEFHLPVFIGTAIVKIEDLWSSVLGNSRFYHRHQVHEVVVEEDVYADDEAARIIDQGDDIDAALFSVLCFQIRPD